MAKYTSDANLIKGAATAYKNWENVPGMYKGLEDLSKAGREMTKTAIADQKAEKKKLEDETKAESKKKQKQDNDWYKVAGTTYENAGSFMKDVELKDVIGKLNDLQPKWTEAMESGTAEEKAAVNAEYQNIKSRVEDHKGFREDIASGEFGVSDAIKNSGVSGGNDGREQAFLTSFLADLSSPRTVFVTSVVIFAAFFAALAAFFAAFLFLAPLNIDTPAVIAAPTPTTINAPEA